MEISIIIMFINLVICYIYNLFKNKESFSSFFSNKKNNLIISSSVVFILSVFYFDYK